MSNDIQSWATLTRAREAAHDARVHRPDAAGHHPGHGRRGQSLIPDAITPHEEAVYTNIAFMESVHAQVVLLDLLDAVLHPGDRRGVPLVGGEREPAAQGRDRHGLLPRRRPLKRKVASTLLESFLFYSGFYLPMYWSSRAKLTNTADLIRLIIRDEAVHGYYIGYKYQKGLEKLTAGRAATSSRTTRSSCSSSCTTTRSSTRRTSTTASA